MPKFGKDEIYIICLLKVDSELEVIIFETKARDMVCFK